MTIKKALKALIPILKYWVGQALIDIWFVAALAVALSDRPPHIFRNVLLLLTAGLIAKEVRILYRYYRANNQLSQRLSQAVAEARSARDMARAMTERKTENVQ